MRESLVLNITGLARAGKSSIITALTVGENVPVVRHSELIKDYADLHNLPLSKDDRGRTYDAAYRALDAEDPDHLTDLVFELTLDNPLVIIDGLRAVRDAKLFKETLGNRYLTSTLVAPTPIRHNRDNTIRAIDGKPPRPIEDFIADEQANINAGYGMLDVLAMHDVSPKPIDTSKFSDPRAAAAQLWLYVRPHVLL